jgi:SAM-dependent methyltransferase
MNESKHITLNKAKWDKWSETADGKGWLYDYLRKAQLSVIALIDVKENMNFLDIGCGTGWAVGRAAKAAGNIGSFYGVDLSSGMIEKAKANFHGYENFHFINANSESIPLDDNLFDNIICTNSFHHYLHPEKAMQEIWRLLKPGGKIYILDPVADIWYIKIIDKVIKLFEPQHVKIYSTVEFKIMMSEAGLKYIGYKVITCKQKVQIGEK